MPRILDPLYGQVGLNFSGRWSSGGARDVFNLSVWNGPAEGPAEGTAPLEVTMDPGLSVLPGLTALVGNLFFADADARAALERFMPGALRFSPVTVRKPKGRPYGQEISLLTLPQSGKVSGGIVVEQSDVRLVENDRIPAGGGRCIDGKPCLRATADPPRLVWNRAAVGERPLWADGMLPGRIVASDGLYAALKAAGVTGFRAQESRFATGH